MTIDVPSLVEAAGGEIVGKIRLQKAIYLLDQMGLDSGFSYEYHHYGPFSADLAEQIEDDVAFGHLEAEQRRRQSDGVPYIVYRSREPGDGEAMGTRIFSNKLNDALLEMQNLSATVLELAATIHWLAFIERYSDWHAELVRRKGVKTQNGRDAQALGLLSRIGLSPGSRVSF